MTKKKSLLREIVLTLRSTALTSSSYQWFGYSSSLVLLIVGLLQLILPTGFAFFTSRPPAAVLGHGLMVGGLSWIMGFLSRRRDLGWGTEILLVIGSLFTLLNTEPDWLSVIAPWLSITATLWLLTRSIISLRTWPEMALAVRSGLVVLFVGQASEIVVLHLGLPNSPSYPLLWSVALVLPCAAAWLFGFCLWRKVHSTVVTTFVAVSGAALVLTCASWMLSGQTTPLVSAFDTAGTLTLCLGMAAVVTAVIQRLMNDRVRPSGAER
jgi:hypothetical protein